MAAKGAKKALTFYANISFVDILAWFLNGHLIPPGGIVVAIGMAFMVMPPGQQFPASHVPLDRSFSGSAARGARRNLRAGDRIASCSTPNP